MVQVQLVRREQNVIEDDCKDCTTFELARVPVHCTSPFVAISHALAPDKWDRSFFTLLHKTFIVDKKKESEMNAPYIKRLHN